MINWIDAPEIAPARVGILLRSAVDLGSQRICTVCREEAVDLVVSVLSEYEVVDLDLSDEGLELANGGIEFQWFPVMDRGTPSDDVQAAAISKVIQTAIQKGRAVVVHCHYGLGRSPLIACMALVDQGLDVNVAIRRVSQARARRVPETDRQLDWLTYYSRSRDAHG